MRIILITGLSGAGKSVALKTLEDIGCEAIDNVPLSLMPRLAEGGNAEDDCLAVGMDARSRDFSPEHVRELAEHLRQAGHRVDILFLDCDDETLRRRFTETRRKHPLALDRPVLDGIQHEREMLAPVRDMASVIFDTSAWQGGDLRQAVRHYFEAAERSLSLFITSFSFRRGLPRDADMVFDVRFLKNPYYDDDLRELTGKDEAVAAYVASDEGFEAFFQHLTNFILPLLPRFSREGKSYLTLAIGCTGGRHRSVFTAEKLAGFLIQKEYKVGIRHRDLPQSD